MFLANTNQYNYVGFENGKHVFDSTDGSEEHRAKEAKLYCTPKHIALIFKADGKVEPTFKSRRKLGDALVERLVTEILDYRSKTVKTENLDVMD